MRWLEHVTPSGMTRRHFLKHTAGASALAASSMAFGHSLQVHANELKKNHKSAILLYERRTIHDRFVGLEAGSRYGRRVQADQHQWRCTNLRTPASVSQADAQPIHRADR